MLKIIACDDDVAFLDRLHRMIDRWSTETGTAVDVALVTRGEDLLAIRELTLQLPRERPYWPQIPVRSSW